jgi:mannose-1-phosphate guanylyltransferase
MRAVVLVGGFGTRLRPLTASMPKPMLHVGNRPIIEHLVAGLARGGVTEVTLAVGFNPQPFRDAFPSGICAGVPLRYAHEPEPLDTAGAVRFAADASGIDETFIVANGDVLTDLDVADLIDAHRSHSAEATIHVYPVDDPGAFGVVELDDDRRVLRFVEKPRPGESPSNLINAGTYVLEPSVLRRIPLGEKVSIERVTFQQLVDAGSLFAHPADVYWLDTGRPEQYLQANLDLLDGRRRWSLDGAHNPASLRCEHSVVSDLASVDRSARVVDSVVLAGGRIGAGAVVQRSVVAGSVGVGAIVVDSVIGADGIVASGAELHDIRLPAAD